MIENKKKKDNVHGVSDINYRDELGNTHLIKSEDLNVLSMLLQNNIDINECNYSGQTALMLSRTPQKTKFLLDNGADVFRLDSFRRHALMYAVCAEQTSLLLNHVRNLWQHDEQKALKIYVNSTDFIGNTALMRSYTAEQSQILLEAGVDVNAKNAHGCTALMYAKDVAQVRMLLKYGADISIKNKEHKDVFELLTERIHWEQSKNRKQELQEMLDVLVQEQQECKQDRNESHKVAHFTSDSVKACQQSAEKSNGRTE